MGRARLREAGQHRAHRLVQGLRWHHGDEAADRRPGEQNPTGAQAVAGVSQASAVQVCGAQREGTLQVGADERVAEDAEYRADEVGQERVELLTSG
ncbi:hypothetical protein AB5J49_46135 [Streptomyces sp. R28]|uniref:Uncharacterized protein n=1 Tax=Streptomyces sp. R28 TaxID=3238628 RepID=A0AB39QB63_9ACTN